MTTTIKTVLSWFYTKYEDLIHFYRYNDMSDIAKAILVIFGLIIVLALFLGAIAFCFLWPLALAWAINYLFGTQIPISFMTWLAIIVLFWASNLFFRGSSTIKIIKK